MAGTTDVIVRFIGDASSIQKETAKVEGTGGRIKGWAKGVGAAIGAAFAVSQIKEWISAASELQDQMSASEQIFGAAAKGVAEFAGNAADAFGISKSGALAAANTFATFGKSAGLSGENLGGFATQLTGLAGDLASFRGTTPEQAIEAIGAALRGETEPIRAYGVLLDDATLRQRALKLGLISTTKNALTPQQKVLAAQAEILAQTTDAQGDFARTSDSAANQQKQLQANLENTQAALGTALLPVLNMILPVLQAFSKFIQENAGWLVPLTAAVLGVAAAVWVFNAALAANPIVLVTIAIAALIAGIILLWKNWDTVWSAIVAAFNWAVSFIVDHWQLILGLIFPFIGALLLLWNNWDTIWKWITGALKWAVGLIIGGFQTVIDFFRKIPGWIGDALSTLGGIIVQPFQWAWEQIVGIKDSIVGVFEAAIQGAKDIWNSFARFWNGINVTVGGQDPLGPLGPSIPEVNLRLPHIPELAAGGIVTRRTLALLGEAGPEAVIPLSHGGAAGVGNVTINITTTGLGADAPAIQRAVVTALQGYTARNGPIAGIAG